MCRSPIKYTRSLKNGILIYEHADKTAFFSRFVTNVSLMVKNYKDLKQPLFPNFSFGREDFPVRSMARVGAPAQTGGLSASGPPGYGYVIG